jgi:hypothetical protein
MTDQDVIKSIKDKKKEFIDIYKTTCLGDNYQVHNTMYFHHICTVLDHAEKLFNCPVKDWLNAENWEDEEETNSTDVEKTHE